MPGEYYTSPDILAEENERIFARSWHCVGRASALAGAGDYMLRNVAGESLIILRDRSGELRAFFNVCRHRGTRLCEAAQGPLLGNDPVPVPRLDVHDGRSADRRAADAGRRRLRQA